MLPTPPSTSISAPSIKDDSSEARKVAALASSIGLPIRPSGTNALISCCKRLTASGSVEFKFICAGVSVGPGTKQLKRIFLDISSPDSVLANEQRAALLAA